jgi:hypothetical protein
MRGREDRAAANQRAIDARNQARWRAVQECRGVLRARPPADERPLPDRDELASGAMWDRLNVGYLRGDWPASRLS